MNKEELEQLKFDAVNARIDALGISFILLTKYIDANLGLSSRETIAKRIPEYLEENKETFKPIYHEMINSWAQQLGGTTPPPQFPEGTTIPPQ